MALPKGSSARRAMKGASERLRQADLPRKVPDLAKQGVQAALHADPRKQVAAGMMGLAALSGAGVAAHAVLDPSADLSRFPAQPAPECLTVLAKPSPNVITGKLPDGRAWRTVLETAAEQSHHPLAPSTVQDLCQIQLDATQDGAPKLTQLDKLQQSHQSLTTPAAENLRGQVRADFIAEADADRILSTQDGSTPQLDAAANARQAGKALGPLAAAQKKGDPQALTQGYEAVDQVERQQAAALADAQRATPSGDLKIILTGPDGSYAAHPEYPQGGAKDPAVSAPAVSDGTRAAEVSGLRSLVGQDQDALSGTLPTLTRDANPDWISDHRWQSPDGKMEKQVAASLAAGKSFADVRHAAQAAYRAQLSPAERAKRLDAPVKNNVAPVYHQLVPLRGPDPQALAMAHDLYLQGYSDDEIRAAVNDYIVNTANAQGATQDQLLRLMPRAPQDKLPTYLHYLNLAMYEGHVSDDAARKEAFLAQGAVECDELNAMVEYSDGTEYNGNVALGNTHPNDGPRYKGRGFDQLTGYDNYRDGGAALGLDLLNHPERAADPDVAFRLGVWYWNRDNLNALADARNFDGITLDINGGYNGAWQRDQYYWTAEQIWG